MLDFMNEELYPSQGLWCWGPLNSLTLAKLLRHATSAPLPPLLGAIFHIQFLDGGYYMTHRAPNNAFVLFGNSLNTYP